MDSKVAERYVLILTFAIDKIYRKDKNGTFDKKDIFLHMGNLTDKTYKNSTQWFTERQIFEKVGDTFSTKYKIHSEFKFRLSKSKDNIKKQCEYIISQLGTFSDRLWDKATETTSNLYEDFFENNERFSFLSTITHQSIKDTLSEVIINDYNKENEGVYHYKLLQTMILTKSRFTVQIKNSQLNIKMKSVQLTKITFNIDTVSLEFNNSKFEIESLGHIKLVEIPKTKGLRDRVDKSLELLQKYDNISVKPLSDLLTYCQNKEDLFFQSL